MKLEIPAKPWDDIPWPKLAAHLKIMVDGNPATIKKRIDTLHRQGATEFADWIEKAHGKRYSPTVQKRWENQTDGLIRWAKKLQDES